MSASLPPAGPAGFRRSIAVAVGLLAITHALVLGSMVGVYRDREFRELHPFIKHRPSTILYFSSPIGEGNLPACGLPPREAQQEDEFVEFVEAGGGYRRSM